MCLILSYKQFTKWLTKKFSYQYKQVKNTPVTPARLTPDQTLELQFIKLFQMAKIILILG